MAESVTVDHGGVTVTTNTATEAALRVELEAPPQEAAEGRRRPQEATTPAAEAPASSGPERDAQGRFIKRDTAAPAAAAAPPTEPALPLEPPAAESEPAPGDGLPRHDPIARMKKALAQKAEAERRATALEQELQRLRQPPAAPLQPLPPPATPPPTNGTGEPQFEQFANDADPYTAYMQAWARWDHARQLDERFARYQAEQAARVEQQTFESRIKDGAQKFPDWQAALTQADTLGLQVSEVMKAAITASPRAADLVHFLATHPEECLQLAEESVQTPVAAAPVMRRLLESQIPVTAPAAPTNGTGTASRPMTSTAKPPVTPVGSSPVVSDAPPGDDASAAEHARYWNRKLKVPGTR